MGRRCGRGPLQTHALLALLVGLWLAGCTSVEPIADDEDAAARQADAVTPTPSPAVASSASPTPTPSPSPSPGPDSPLPDDLELELDVVAEGLDQPIFVTAPPDDPRLFVVEKGGRVRIVEGGELRPRPFLSIRRKVRGSGPTSELGMFALAFHPEYASNGRFFVHYTASPSGNTRVEEYRVSESDPYRADRTTRRTILRVDQPFRWHNGGMLMFGPDGMLWLGLGDGGLKNDPDDHGQNPRTLLGTILRVDVDAPADGKRYAIPADNPFADGEDGAPEVWAYGLRNPWRFDIDPARQLLYIADVGEYKYEEVNVVGLDEPGRNFGWAVREGSGCFSGGQAGCRSKGLVDPDVEYLHEDSCAVVGGFVYRGRAIPELRGRYFYTDFCNGRIRSFRYKANGKVVEKRDWSTQIEPVALPTSFGLDANGELYITSAEGTVYRFVSATG